MSALDTLISNLQIIHNETMNKLLPENIKQGITIFGVEGTVPVNCKTYSTIEEMLNSTATEDDYAIVYGTTYIGTFRYDGGTWTQIGDSSDEQKIMDVLNKVMTPVEQYEGNGGTDEEINAVLDNILGEGGNV